jgi:hypothetical protein
MEADQKMLADLMAGTRAMRAAGETYLPKWPAEENDAWARRKDTATLFPAYRRTVSVMVGKPFSKALTLGDDVPPQIVDWAEDIDLEGVNLHAFAAEMFGETFYGLAGILVDAPPLTEQVVGRPMTRAEQRAANVRPYFVRVRHDQILGYRTAVVNGARRLTQLRLSETATVEDGEFGEKTVKRVRILTPGAFRVMEKVAATTNTAESWTDVSSGTTGLNAIPFVPLYGWRKGFMDGRPPLVDLAFLNVKHWQSQSDQDTILHVARVPILSISGADDKTKLAIGGSSAVALPMGGKLEWVEHTGAAIKAGHDSIEALEEQMIQAGAELLVKKPGQRTATESTNDAEANKSDLQRMVETLEDGLDQALQFMADYASLPSGGHVSLFKDFGAGSLSEASGQLILAMRDRGLISDETAINEMKRRGELAAEVEAEDEREKIGQQPPAMGMIEPAPTDDPADDTEDQDTVEGGEITVLRR